MTKLFTFLGAMLIATTVYAGEVADVSIPDLRASIEGKKVTLLDANGTESWTEAHIPGAIDFKANKEKIATLLPKNKNALVVAYCGGPQCGAYMEAVKAAKKLGYTNIKHLSAGISGWQKAGEKTESGK